MPAHNVQRLPPPLHLDPSGSRQFIRRPFPWKQWVERAALVLLVLLFLKTGFIPAWTHLNSDFPNSYLVARLFREGYPLERVYDWTWFQRQKDRANIDQGLIGFIPQTIPSALVVAPWSSLPPLPAKRWWLAANLVFLLLIAVLLTICTRLGALRVVLLIFLAFVPLRNNFLLGQLHVFVLLLLTLAAWLYFKDRFYFCGVVLALAATAKIYPGLFLVFVLFKKQWRAAIGILVGLSIAGAASLYAFGTDACLLYAREVLPRALRAETTDPYNVAWNSFAALIRRLFILEPELNPAPVAHLPWLYAGLQPLVHSLIFVVFMWAIGSQKQNKNRIKIEWAAYLFLLLFLSSQPGSYHFVALILSAVLVVDHLVAHEQHILAGIAVLIYAMVCGPLIQFPSVSPTGWQSVLFFSRLAWMTVFGGLVLWMLISPLPESLRILFNFRSVAYATAALLVLVVAGFVSTEKNLRGQFDNYKSRVITTPGALFASDAAVGPDFVLFTGMSKEGYTIRRLQSGATIDFPRIGGDWFHPAVPEQGDWGWAEQASQGGSRVVRFSTDPSGPSTAGVTLEVENAEEPVVSRDGQFLAYLRPVNGRNSLWITKPRAAIGNIEEEKEIAGTSYDVHEATFLPDNKLIFSSRRTGQFALYLANPLGNVEQMTAPICSARYPAASSDGRWIAYSCEHRGSWQLYVMELRGKHEIQLTAGDCNSTKAAWTEDSKHLIYSTDCGRGLGLTALAQVSVTQ
jgi:hypothetical protein